MLARAHTGLLRGSRAKWTPNAANRNARARVAPQQVATPEQVATAQVATVPVAVPVEAPAIWGEVVNS
jgi:hypothetical protein